jgi:hypothetical protein
MKGSLHRLPSLWLLLLFSPVLADRVLLDEVGSEGAWSSLELDAGKAKEGRAGWKSAGAAKGTLAVFKQAAADWSGAQALKFWLWSSANLGAEVFIQVTAPGPHTNGDYWMHRLKVDWAGWKQVEVPREKFLKVRSPDGWKGVTSLGFLTSGWGVTANAELQFALDRVELIGDIPLPMKAASAKATNMPAQTASKPPTASPAAKASGSTTTSSEANASKPAAPERIRALLDEEETPVGWTGLEKNPQLAKSGKVGWHWKGPAVLARSFDPKEDFTKYNALRFWMHSEVANGQDLMLQVVNPGPNGNGDYWGSPLKVDWAGWKQVTIRLDKMNISRAPDGMKAVSRIAFNMYWGGIVVKPDTKLHLDGVELVEGPRQEAVKTGVRPARVFPKEVSIINVDDLKLPSWAGRIALANMPWDGIIQEAAADPDVGNVFIEWKKQAANWAVGDIIRRSKRLEDVPRGRLDSRVGACGPNAEIFALAMDDCAVWGGLGRQLIPAALVVRRSGDKAALEYLTRQLTEIATWFPIQRAGWTQYTATKKLVGEHDGPWLAEGYALVSLAFTLDILGDRLDAKLRADMRTLLQKQVDWIVRAWKENIPWYVKAKAYRSNQWALPSSALALACLVLGDEKNRAAYELAAENLAKVLAAQGESGSFAEGYAYASMTMDFVLPALWAMDRAGDKRLGGFPFLKKYATWINQMTMPGKTVVNHSDCGTTWAPATPGRHLMLATLVSQSPADLWAMDHFYLLYNMADPFSIIYKAEARKLTPARTPLPNHAFFANMQLAVWRTDWDLENAMALWAKGGTLNDFHIHNDQGQVVVMNGTEPIFIDSGAVAYGDPEYDSKFACSAGHNVLQTPSGLNRLKKEVRVPLAVERMDDRGGKLWIDASEAQPEVKSWQRRVEWAAEGRVTVSDEAEMFDGKQPGDEWFRWHTGAQQQPGVSGAGKAWTVSWGSNRLTLVADRPIAVEALEWRSALLKKHFVVVVRAAEAGDKLNLVSTVAFPRKASRPLTALISYVESLKGRKPGAVGEPIVLQGEDMIPPGGAMRAVTNKVGAKSAITGWDAMGSRLETTVEIPEDGWYFLGIKYCTAFLALRAVEIDGVVPFAEADRISLPVTLPHPNSDGFANNADDWTFALLGARADRPGLLFRLSQGKRRISFVNRANACNVDYFVLIPEGKSKQDFMDR